MPKTTYFKVKNLRQFKIRKPKSINALLNQGYAVSKVTEIKNKTTIKTYSPLTKSVAFKKRLQSKQILKGSTPAEMGERGRITKSGKIIRY